ncbi:hypothetical protein [Geobacillus sp. WSUCF-018B]|uniref:hypothetical protein n=1 Tax=Geobacillus sp. WSUCF-018B TaxID=2055939 RepID=UPI000C287CF2|nr:hypothetical protein [Geobacillus sp. WSUCF-018B]PJW18897.1 hypothetical protein CV944_01455 [Geobacillus sp. WSUCF-018B]
MSSIYYAVINRNESVVFLGTKEEIEHVLNMNMQSIQSHHHLKVESFELFNFGQKRWIQQFKQKNADQPYFYLFCNPGLYNDATYYQYIQSNEAMQIKALKRPGLYPCLRCGGTGVFAKRRPNRKLYRGACFYCNQGEVSWEIFQRQLQNKISVLKDEQERKKDPISFLMKENERVFQQSLTRKEAEELYKKLKKIDEEDGRVPF